MNTNMKDKVKMSVAISILSIIVIIVLMIVVQYQIEGEKNMPYKLSKIIIISTAEGERASGQEDTIWDLTVNQSNDIYFFIDKNTEKEEIIDSVTIENIQITKAPTKGTIQTFMPSSVEGSDFTYNEEYIVENKLEYKGGKTSNPKSLEIGNQGGSALIRFSNTNIGKFTSNEGDEIKYDGTLITKAGIQEEDIKFQVNFDLVIQINKIKYKANITLDLPCNKICEDGTTTREITDMSNIAFKRIQ